MTSERVPITIHIHPRNAAILLERGLECQRVRLQKDQNQLIIVVEDRVLPQTMKARLRDGVPDLRAPVSEATGRAGTNPTRP